MIGPLGTKLVPASASKVAATSAPAVPDDRFEPATSSLEGLMKANAFPQVRNAPSGPLTAFVGQGLEVRDGAGAVWQVFDRRPNRFQWLDASTLLVEADRGGDEAYRLSMVRADGRPWDGTDSPVRPVGDPRGTQEICFRAGGRVYYRSDARVPGSFDLHELDGKTGDTRRVFEGEGRMDYVLRRQDGRVIASRQDTNTANSLHLVDPASGRSTPLTPPLENARYEPIAFQPDGRLLCISNEGREHTAPVLIDIESGARQWLARTSADTDKVAVSPNGREILCIVNDHGWSKLARYDTATGDALPTPALPQGVVSRIAWKGEHAVSFALSTPTAPQEAGEMSLETGEVRWTQRADVALPGLVQPELVQYPSADGTVVSGFLYRPPSAEGHAVPAVIHLHGGPESQTRPRFDPMVQHLVDRGIAVLTPNVRGSLGFGKTFLDADNGAGRKGAIEDVRASARFLERVGVDPLRIGLMGPSYGGYLTLAALAFLTDVKWAAAAEQAGPADLTAARDDEYQAEFGADPEVLRELSPALRAEAIQTPLLVVHGENDPQVPRAQSDAMVEALQKHGKPVEYLVVPGEGHVFRNPDTRLEVNQKMADFLVERLQPDLPGPSIS